MMGFSLFLAFIGILAVAVLFLFCVLVPSTKTPSYRSVYFCSSCVETLSFKEVYCSDGVCPKCGSVSDGTIVAHYKDSRKK